MPANCVGWYVDGHILRRQTLFSSHALPSRWPMSRAHGSLPGSWCDSGMHCNGLRPPYSSSILQDRYKIAVTSLNISAMNLVACCFHSASRGCCTVVVAGKSRWNLPWGHAASVAYMRHCSGINARRTGLSQFLVVV